MAEIEISVSREEVWDEVAKATAYAGAKALGDDSAYERILLTDADAEELQRFWDEACAVANEQLKEMLEESGMTSDGYRVRLHVGSQYDTVLNESVQIVLRNYFIGIIMGSWYKNVNKEEALEIFRDSSEMLEGAKRMLYSRKRPERAQKKRGKKKEEL